ncbi:MAG: hypothetical protein JWO74_471 [Solirubrobacterales bacterium]|jgi:6-phosphogluconolactonase (cycloisomerase 2 family)|nr:hypothetical protein [Solirubrobacterales bacterium]
MGSALAVPAVAVRRVALVLAVGLLVFLALAAAAMAGPRALYVTNAEHATASVSSFPVALGTGALGTETTTTGDASGSNSTASAMSPDGKYLYTANAGADRIDVFSVDHTDGTLSASSHTAQVPGMASMFALAVSPDGQYLYAVGNDGQHNPGSKTMTAVQGFSVDAVGGSLTPDGGLVTDGVSRPYANPENGLAIAIAPDGKNVFTATFAGNEISNFPVDVTNGQLGSPANADNGSSGSSGPLSLSVSPKNDALYVADDGNGTSGTDVSVYPLSGGVLGARTDVPSGGLNPGAVAVSPDGAWLYVTNEGDGTSANPASVASFAIDSGGGLTSPPAIASDPGAGFPQSIAVAPDGGHLYVGNITSSLTGNVETYSAGAGGSLTPLGNGATDTLPYLDALVISPDQAPTAALAAPASPTAETPITLDASSSSDPDGTVARYDWNFGDGTTATDAGPHPAHTYHQTGSVTATVTVTDNEGCSTTLVHTGQTVSCNGSTSAVTSRMFTLTKPAGPTCAGDSASTANNTAVDVPLTCTGATALTYSASGAGPKKGTATVSGSTLHYTPDLGAVGTDTLTVVATDAYDQPATETVTVAIGAPAAGASGGAGPGAGGPAVDHHYDLAHTVRLIVSHGLVRLALHTRRLAIPLQNDNPVSTTGTATAVVPGSAKALATNAISVSGATTRTLYLELSLDALKRLHARHVYAMNIVLDVTDAAGDHAVVTGHYLLAGPRRHHR